MTTLSCYSAVKRTSSHTNEGDIPIRPPVSPLYMDVAFTGDRSGSMGSTQGGSQTGARDYIKKQVEAANLLVPQLGFYIDFTTFDDRIENPFSGSAAEVTDAVLTRLASAMEPRGSTRLYDAILDSLKRQMIRLENQFDKLAPEAKGLVRNQPWLFGAACTPMTDGQDNASAPGAAEESLNAMLNFVENYSATGMVLAANRNAATLASELGLDPEAALQMGTTQAECRTAMNCAAAAQLRACSSGGIQPPPTMGRYFTQLERESSCTQHPYEMGHAASCPARMTPPRLNRSVASGSPPANPLPLNQQNTILPPPPPPPSMLLRPHMLRPPYDHILYQSQRGR